MASCSGGMDGYISLPAGDPCPRIFRSPIEGMEDIKDNRVICAVYKLPDPQHHIARPPAGVQIPRKTVMLEDLKPAPALWHEENGHKPWANARNLSFRKNVHNEHKNPRGSISGQKLGAAAHRLVVNSLQVTTDKKVTGHQPSAPAPSLVSPHSQYHHPPRGAEKNRRHSNPGGECNNRQSYASSIDHPQPGRPPFSRGGRTWTRGRNHHQQPGRHQNGHVYSPIETTQGPTKGQGGGDNFNQHQGRVWVPRGSNSRGRGGNTCPKNDRGNQIKVLNKDATITNSPLPARAHES